MCESLFLACEPVTVGTALLYGSLALSAAGTAASLAAQKQQADAQTQHQQELVAANNTETSNELSELRIQQAQSRESTAREGEKARKASEKAKSTAAVAAGEAGVSGNSVDALLREYSMNLGQFKENATRQRQLDDAAFDDKAHAITSDAGYRNLNMNAPVTGPNYASAALDLSASALHTYRLYKPELVAGKG